MPILRLIVFIGVILPDLNFFAFIQGAVLHTPSCGSSWITLKTVDSGFIRIVSFRARCKRWDCPVCSAKKSTLYGRRISEAFNGQQLWFYTLTFYHDKSVEEAWRSSQEAWNRLNISFKKRYGTFPYVRVLESHKISCYPHYHVLSSKFVAPTVFGPLAKAAGFGYKIKVQRVSSSGVSGYLRKYLSKTWPREDAAKLRSSLRLRIVTFSRDVKFPSLPESGFSFCGISSSKEQLEILIRGIIDFYSPFEEEANVTIPGEISFEYGLFDRSESYEPVETVPCNSQLSTVLPTGNVDEIGVFQLNLFASP